MKIFYSRKLLGMKRYSSWIPMTSVLLVILLEIMAAYQDVWSRNLGFLRLVADFAPLILCIVGISTDKGKGFHVFLKNGCGRLYLLPVKNFLGRSQEAMDIFQAHMEKRTALSSEAREILNTISVRKIGTLYWIRCVVEGENMIKNLMITENYVDYQELVLEFMHRE